MGDPDVRNALARRLQRNISDVSQGSKSNAPVLSGNPKLPPSTPATAVSTTMGPETIDVMSLCVSGYLYKFSSGTLGRWQKRYFVLESGRLSYFKKAPSDKDRANKVFSIRRVKTVSSSETGVGDDREFKLVFTNGKIYQMRAPTHEDMQKWVSSLRGSIAFFEQTPVESTIPGLVEDELSDDDGMTSAQGSVMSENRPPPESPTQSSEHKLSSRLHGLIPRRESLSGVLHAAGHGLSSLKHAVIPGSLASAPPDTSMLEVEIDPDQLDKNFEEWFYFVPGLSSQKETHATSVQIHRDIKMSHITDACGKANQHLWWTLANLARGSEVKLEEAVGRARSRMGAPEAVERAAIIIEEYFSRLSKYVMKSIDIRSAVLHSWPRLGHGRTTLGLGASAVGDSLATPEGLVSELPQIMDCITRISGLAEKLLSPESVKHATGTGSSSPSGSSKEERCYCCYCDPSGVAMLKLERLQGGKKNLQIPPNACMQDKWRKYIRGILQRIGGELEVGLIEELQNLIQSAQLAWESPPRLTVPTDESVFGPSPQQHPLLDDMFINPTPGIKMSPPKILMSSFGPAFVQSAQSRCLNAASQWMAAYPSSARLISEHSSSALVASLNSVWRQFKRVAGNASERANTEVHKKYTESMRNSREDALRSSASSQGSPRNNRRGSRASSVGSQHDAILDLEHLVSFSNECVLISRFCAKTWSNGVSAKFTPEVFLTCMDGLSSGLLATAVDVCHSIVCLHFAPRVKFDLNKMFHAKNLAHSHSTPMAHGRVITEQFVASLDVLSPLACVREAVVALLGPALMRGYMGALFRNKPKLKTFKTVPEMVKGDVELFKETFSSFYKVASGPLEATMKVVEELVGVLNERNRLNYSIHFNVLAKLINSRAQALVVIQNITKMREHEWPSSNDKKDILNMLNHIKGEAQDEHEEDDHTEKPKIESVIKKGPKGTVLVSLGVGVLKLKWKFDD